MRDLLVRQIGDALRAVRGKAPLSDEAIHRARKTLKRARASLRLLRDAIGESNYARENARLRDAARPLARVRDAKVTLEALERFLERERKDGRRRDLLRLRGELRRERFRLRRELHASGDLKHIARSLAAAMRRVKGWAVGQRDSPALRSGLERIYRRGRKALAETESEDTDENLHELRKQAKYLALALEVFKPMPSHAVVRLARRAEAVADRLGADRDLAVLRDRVVALPAPSIQAHEALIAQIARSRAKPQKKALEAGRRLYRKKAKAVGRRFEAAL